MSGRKNTVFFILGGVMLSVILLAGLLFCVFSRPVAEIDRSVLEYIEQNVDVVPLKEGEVAACAVKVIDSGSGHLCLYVFKANFSVRGENLHSIGATIFPLNLKVLRIGNRAVIGGYAIPDDGESHGASMKKIFSPAVLEKLRLVTSEDISKLQAEAEKRAEQKLNRLADT